LFLPFVKHGHRDCFWDRAEAAHVPVFDVVASPHSVILVLPHSTQGKCSCYAGFDGAACDTATNRPNQCNGLVGVNLEGVSDWSHSW
jgi:hypothetical protein